MPQQRRGPDGRFIPAWAIAPEDVKRNDPADSLPKDPTASLADKISEKSQGSSPDKGKS